MLKLGQVLRVCCLDSMRPSSIWLSIRLDLFSIHLSKLCPVSIMSDNLAVLPSLTIRDVSADSAVCSGLSNEAHITKELSDTGLG